MDANFRKDLMTALEDYHTKNFLIQKKEDEIEMLKKKIEETKAANEILVQTSNDTKLQIGQAEAVFSCQRLDKEQTTELIESTRMKVEGLVMRNNKWIELKAKVKQAYEDKLKQMNDDREKFKSACREKVPAIKAMLEAQEKLAMIEKTLEDSKLLLEAERKKVADQLAVETKGFEEFKQKCVTVSEGFAALNTLRKSAENLALRVEKFSAIPGLPANIPTTNFGFLPSKSDFMPPTFKPFCKGLTSYRRSSVQTKTTKLAYERNDFREKLKALDEAAALSRINSQQRKTSVRRAVCFPPTFTTLNCQIDTSTPKSPEKTQNEVVLSVTDICSDDKADDTGPAASEGTDCGEKLKALDETAPFAGINSQWETSVRPTDFPPSTPTTSNGQIATQLIISTPKSSEKTQNQALFGTDIASQDKADDTGAESFGMFFGNAEESENQPPVNNFFGFGQNSCADITETNNSSSGFFF